METKDIERWAEGLLTVSLVSEQGPEHTVWVLLRHLFAAVKLHDLLSDDDRRRVADIVKKTKGMFDSRFSLKERKRKTKKQKGLPLAHPTKEKETNKEKAGKTRESAAGATSVPVSVLDEGQQAFWDECQTYIGRPYDKQMVKNFFLYWAERRTGGDSRMLWQTKRTWNTAFRLATWSRRSYNVNDELAAISLNRCKARQAQQQEAAAHEQSVAQRREEEARRREREAERSKAGAMTTSDYVTSNPDGFLARCARERAAREKRTTSTT